MIRPRRMLACLLALVLVPATPAAALPELPAPPVDRPLVGAPPRVTAGSWIVFDETRDLVLAAQAEHERRPMASTTKIMTALVALEAGAPDDLVTVSRESTEVGEAEIGLEPGERFPLSQLVTVLLVRSANDAALAVAEAVAGSEDRFVEMMNARAQDLGLDNTRFANPHGLDEPDHHSSAYDLLRLTRAAMENPAFARAVSTLRVRLPAASDGTPRVAETTNRLLTDYEGALGVKTGFTLDAGLVLVAAAAREGRRLYVVVMGSEGEDGHFTDAAALLDYGFGGFGLLEVVEGDARYTNLGAGRDPVVVAGTWAALLHLAAAGVLEHAEAESPFADLALSPPRSERPPDLVDALGWVDRYWEWAISNG